MRCYDISLASEQTVLATAIKSSTIKGYLQSVGKLYMSAVGFGPRYFGPKPSTINLLIDWRIKCIIEEIKQWEG